MKIRLKKRGTFGVKKIGLDGNIGKIEKSEGLRVFVKGLEGLGVVVFSPKEVEMLMNKIKPEKEVKEKKNVVGKKGKKKTKK